MKETEGRRVVHGIFCEVIIWTESLTCGDGLGKQPWVNFASCRQSLACFRLDGLILADDTEDFKSKQTHSAYVIDFGHGCWTGLTLANSTVNMGAYGILLLLQGRHQQLFQSRRHTGSLRISATETFSKVSDVEASLRSSFKH